MTSVTVGSTPNTVIVVSGTENIAARISAKPTVDAGGGTVEGDTNATNWTGHANAEDTALKVGISDYLLIGHKDVVYQYVGKQNVLLGLGGDYMTVSTDFVAISTSDHALLENIGTTTHAALDTHVNDASKHFTVGNIVHANISGLTADDHTNYLNNLRGDARYAPISHGSGTGHPAADITYDNTASELTAVTSQAAIDELDATSDVQTTVLQTFELRAVEQAILKGATLTDGSDFLTGYTNTFLPNQPVLSANTRQITADETAGTITIGVSGIYEMGGNVFTELGANNIAYAWMIDASVVSIGQFPLDVREGSNNAELGEIFGGSTRVTLAAGTVLKMLDALGNHPTITDSTFYVNLITTQSFT